MAKITIKPVFLDYPGGKKKIVEYVAEKNENGKTFFVCGDFLNEEIVKNIPAEMWAEKK